MNEDQMNQLVSELVKLIQALSRLANAQASQAETKANHDSYRSIRSMIP